MKLSIILPIYNEEGNIIKLYEELKDVLAVYNNNYEIICVNDGSVDNSLKILGEIAVKDPSVKVINFIHNFGQTAAMSAGINNATGDVVIPMDADGQNDPADIPKFLEKIEEGYDLVSGWRQERWQGAYFTRKLPSMIANRLIYKLTKIKLHDTGCTMKAYKKEMLTGLNLYGEMHRFIASYVALNKGRIAEITVNSRPRLSGQTKYDLTRTYKVILDLVVFKFLAKYMDKPIHFFGGIGFISLFIGLFAGLTAIILKIFNIRSFIATPLPIFSALFIIVGVQLVVMGILAEMIMRTYYESQNKRPYIIKEKINF